MIQSMKFNVGTRDGKWYAVWDDPDGNMEGPPRDTHEEALKDRDYAVQMAVMSMRTHIPGSNITVGRIQ
jgi:hypothetical protein